MNYNKIISKFNKKIKLFQKKQQQKKQKTKDTVELI